MTVLAPDIKTLRALLLHDTIFKLPAVTHVALEHRAARDQVRDRVANRAAAVEGVKPAGTETPARLIVTGPCAVFAQHALTQAATVE